MIYRLNGTIIEQAKHTTDAVIMTYDLVRAVMCIGYAEDFDNEIKRLSEQGLLDLIDYLTAINCEWTEGVLLCEREIARRGHDEPKSRFEL